MLFSPRYEDGTRLARQVGENLPPPLPSRDPWPGTLATNSDGTVADGSTR